MHIQMCILNYKQHADLIVYILIQALEWLSNFAKIVLSKFIVEIEML